MESDWPAQFVVLVLPMAASPIPVFEYLSGFPRQGQAPSRIDAVRHQCRARQAVKRNLVRPGCCGTKPWITLSHQPPGSIMLPGGDSRSGFVGHRRAKISHLPYRQATTVYCSQRRRMAMEV
ncbi:hypothetical protein D3C71_1249190 [compost metagenome]